MSVPEFRFACQGCGKCCSGHGWVFVAPEEWRGLARHLGMDEADFLARYTRRAEGRIALVDASGGDCIFLGPGGCAVYAARPWQCRAWPFWFGNVRSAEAWAKTGTACPGVGRGRVYSTDEVREWLEGSPFLKRG